MITPSQVHIWSADLGAMGIRPETLSADERERAMRFHFEKDRRRYIAARGALRQILGKYLGMEPREIRFVYSPYGKPALAPEMNGDDLRFNLSHAGGMALYALTCGRDIGVDIEQIRDEVDYEEIARTFFSPAELSSLGQIPASRRREVFFQYWTRKEAFLKATGEGLSFPSERVDVLVAGDQTGDTRWFIKDLSPAGGYAAAIAVGEFGPSGVFRDKNHCAPVPDVLFFSLTNNLAL